MQKIAYAASNRLPTLLKEEPKMRPSVEEVAMRACARQFEDEHVFVDVVDQEPVGRDVTFAMMRPVVRKLVIAHGFGECYSIGAVQHIVVRRKEPFDFSCG